MNEQRGSDFKVGREALVLITEWGLSSFPKGLTRKPKKSISALDLEFRNLDFRLHG
jgi:hypothetical protein